MLLYKSSKSRPHRSYIRWSLLLFFNGFGVQIGFAFEADTTAMAQQIAELQEQVADLKKGQSTSFWMALISGITAILGLIGIAVTRMSGIVKK